MNRIITVVTIFIIALIAAAYVEGAAHSTNQYAGQLLPKISAYNIFTGDLAALTPGNGFQLYELATGLFTDYAEKQRLIKVPPGTTITAMHDGLPQFPDGTILVKTFYYFNDKRNEAAGKRLIETRLLIKNNGQWMAGTYVWNKEQTDAMLTTAGLKTAVHRIDEQANNRSIVYKVPATKDCASCHNANNSLMPVGIKIRNLNRDVVRNNTTVNQLQYLQNAGVMNAVDVNRFTRLPNWQNENNPVQERVRAYLDVNCAHCHSDAGTCARSTLRFEWEISMAGAGIEARKKQIIKMMEKGRMPRIGTTIVDKEALALIKKYLQSY